MRLTRLSFNPPCSVCLVDLIYHPPLVNLQLPLNCINKHNTKKPVLYKKNLEHQKPKLFFIIKTMLSSCFMLELLYLQWVSAMRDEEKGNKMGAVPLVPGFVTSKACSEFSAFMVLECGINLWDFVF